MLKHPDNPKTIYRQLCAGSQQCRQSERAVFVYMIFITLRIFPLCCTMCALRVMVSKPFGSDVQFESAYFGSNTWAQCDFTGFPPCIHKYTSGKKITW